MQAKQQLKSSSKKKEKNYMSVRLRCVLSLVNEAEGTLVDNVGN